MSARASVFPICVAALLCGCGGGEEPSGGDAGPAALTGGEPWFEDATDAAGVRFVHVYGRERRFWFPEIMGSGLGFGDLDGDGWLDLYLVQGGDLEDGPGASAANALLRNRADGTFEDVTEGSGAADRGYGMGCAFGDVDGDGRLDVFVSNVGPNVLLRNEGELSFEDVTAAAGVGDPRWGTSSAFLDYDTDGDLDLFVVNYLGWSKDREIPCSSSYGPQDYCNPNNYGAPAADVLYRNDGKGSFTNVSSAAGISRAFGNGLGVATGDFDGNGRPDVYVANDLMANQLWLGQPDGTFRDDALLAGCALDQNGEVEAGMGVLAMDVENDGDLDLFMTHLRAETNTFYLNEGQTFADQTASMGLSTPSYSFTGFGVGAADFDHDGRLDLYVTNGRVTFGRPLFRDDAPFAEPDQLFRGLASHGFEEVSPRAGLAGEHYNNGRGLALGDYDNDGDVDVAISNNGGEAKLLRNVRASGSGWIGVRVVTSEGRDALGALVGIGGEGEGRQWRQVQAAYSYCSSNDPRVHFGLGARTGTVEVEVRWLDGTRERFGPLEAGRYHTVQAGGGRR